MQLTDRQKQRIKVRFYSLVYELVTRSSLYFVAGLIVGVMLVTHQFMAIFSPDNPLEQLITSCDALIKRQ